ncbi:MAG: hypothetical protein VB050_03750 [Geobacteraceae bacterium]|nr:hypothetical protein [Geobacteraceae bacterium]
MNKTWPSVIRIIFKSENVTVPSLLVYLEILSRLKNNYSIGPCLTDDDGEVKIPRDTIDATIERAKEISPMDYKGNLEDCVGVEVIVETVDELNNRILRGGKFYPKEAKKLKDLLIKCTNTKYLGKRVVINMPTDLETIVVDLTSSNLKKK